MNDVKVSLSSPNVKIWSTDHSESRLLSNACYIHRTTIQLFFDFGPDKMRTNQSRIFHYQRVLLTTVSWLTNPQGNPIAIALAPEG